MARERIRLYLLAFTLVFAAGAVSAETWRLGQSGSLEKISQQDQDRYLLAVSELKTLVSQGKIEEVAAAINKLKRDFPEVATEDLDEFLKAERLYAQGKFTQAIRSYETFLERYPQSPLYDAAIDREFAIAQAYLGGHKKTVLKFIRMKGYSEGVKIMDKIIDRAGNSPIAIKAAVAIAESYEARGKYEQAYQRWSQISARWPTGEIGKEALLAMARCKHAAYRGPAYDVSDLISAKSYYENFKRRYPEDAKKLEIDKKLEQIRQQIAYKEYSIAAYYHRVGNKQGANLYSQMVLDQWPDSIAAKRAMDILDENQSIETEKAEQ